MTNSFHNTINASGDALVAHTITCTNQEERVLAIFKEVGPDINMSPFKVHELYSKLYKEVPITSIRRAMTNLTKSNNLIKTRCMIDEKHGMPNFTWTLNTSFGK